MIILAIESSCDESSVAVVTGEGEILSNVIRSQIKNHKRFGGVVPELASRLHAESFHRITDKALEEANMTLSDVDVIAVTSGPGLEGALLIGVCYAKTLGVLIGKPVIPINHLHGHIFAGIKAGDSPFPYVGLIVSGGHTLLVKCDDGGVFDLLGVTRDDACGEAFDKVARMLGLAYPGGPEIELQAKDGDPKAVRFPRAMIKDGLEFSFSGLKTAVMQYVKANPDTSVPDICASFQACVGDILVAKATRACKQVGTTLLVVSGGVAANAYLSGRLQSELADQGITVNTPPKGLCTDNAGMIGLAACRWIDWQGIQERPFHVVANLGVRIP
ncbi:tRNA (adenosine(37)-N6)-threonylcarbamoyltransferase complex transferase subunit TsaD [bacterium]|jgi:N6-L-threonylcarbamoyladenine synthase|nr:tRNA (adenosine(37)-N6)-threonylcarbamoyltransferase complex transferase subunit TsaD [bacterium]